MKIIFNVFSQLCRSQLYTFCYLKNDVTEISSTNTVLCCYLNKIGCRWHETWHSGLSSITSWDTHSLRTPTPHHPIPHRVACYVSIAVDAVHCPPLDSDAGGGHSRYTHRSGSSRWSCMWEIQKEIKQVANTIISVLTCNHCGGYETVFCSLPITQ